MKMKKLIALGLAGLLSLSMLTACAKTNDPTKEPEKEAVEETLEETSSQETEQTETTEKEPVTITALINQSRYYQGLQNMIEKLEEEEKITIEVQVIPDDQYLNLVQVKINSGECADLVDLGIPNHYTRYNVAEDFLDLSNEPWVENLVSPDNIIAADGKIYGMPFKAVQGVMGFIYNQQVFDDAGVAVPTTWDEVLDACEKLKAAGVTPIHYPKDTWVPQIFMSAGYAQVLGDEGREFGRKLAVNEAKWTDKQEMADVIDLFLSLFEKGYVNEDFLSVTYDDTIAAIGTGEAAMTICGDYFAASVVEAFPDAKLGMFNVQLPGAPEDVMIADTSSVGFAIYKNSPNAEVAKKVLNLWSTPEYANLYFESQPAVPAFKGVDGGETPDYLKDVTEKYVMTGKTLPEMNALIPEANSVIDKTIWVYYLEAAAKGNMDGMQILEKFQGDYEKFMQDSKAPGF